MALRGDFYLGRGKQSVWLGSISHEVASHDLAHYFEGVTSELEFREALANVFLKYGEIKAAMGWPWPWGTSAGTGLVGAFDDGHVWVCDYNRTWQSLSGTACTESSPNAGLTVAVFPDMASQEEATAEGRLRRGLRISGTLAIPPDQPVLPFLLTRVAYLLDRDWMHAHRDEDKWQLLEPGISVQNAVFDLMLVVHEHLETVKQLVAAQQAQDSLEFWELVLWAYANLKYRGGQSLVSVPLTPSTPVFFGQPLAPALRAQLSEGTFPFIVEEYTAAHARGRQLLTEVLAEIPSLHAQVVWHELQGTYFYKTNDSATAMAEPRPELGGLSLAEAGGTPEGRERINALANVWRFEREF